MVGQQALLAPSVGLRSSKGPLWTPPLSPTLVDVPAAGDKWQHEIKYDGYRTLIVRAGRDVVAFTRRGHDWTAKYEPVVAEVRQLRCRSCSIDGEMIVQDEQGRSDFAAFQKALGRDSERLIFMAFDLLELDGEDLRRQPLQERRGKLRALLGANRPHRRLQMSEEHRGSGADLLAAACAMGLEGIVSKKIDSVYRSGPQKTWLKTKCYDEGEFVVVGAEHEAGRPAFALLAREEGAGLVYVGSAFLTLSGASRDRFWNQIEATERATRPLETEKRDGCWVESTMRVRVQFLRGEHGKLRHASVKELLG